jgi:hypothetical protein
MSLSCVPARASWYGPAAVWLGQCVGEHAPTIGAWPFRDRRTKPRVAVALPRRRPT